jgi:ubiquinone/menaquinone biosynthesis C-methylase UbiE
MAEHFGHAVMPQTTHDEFARERFWLDMRAHLLEKFDPIDRQLCNEYVAPRVEKETGKRPTRSAEIREALESEPFHQAWLSLQRQYQDGIYKAVGASVDRQYEHLANLISGIEAPKGSLRLDPDFEVPRYIAAFDHHRMAGSYHTETADDDFRAGAIYDRFSSTYHYYSAAGWRNDLRGHTLASHVVSMYPDLEVKRVLDIGCAVGTTTTALAEDFPEAEIHAIDIGAPMLRYAFARAEALGHGIHFSQQNAEQTDFPDGYFDLVVSAVTLHETSLAALRNILAECRRILRPGGVMVHMEIPARYDELGLWEQVRADFESHYNNEPFMIGVSRVDFDALCREAGFAPENIQVGFRDGTPKMVRTDTGFRAGNSDGKLHLGSYYTCSAVR